MELLAGTLRIDDLDAFLETIDAIASDRETTIQAFDARYVAGRHHLERSVALADRAFERGENVARDRAVEILLYAAGRRQIDRALEMGVAEGETDAVVLIEGEASSEAAADLAARFDLERDPTLEGGDEDVLCDFFEITDAEREATDASLEDLVCERVALLEVEK